MEIFEAVQLNAGGDQLEDVAGVGALQGQRGQIGRDIHHLGIQAKAAILEPAQVGVG